MKFQDDRLDEDTILTGSEATRMITMTTLRLLDSFLTFVHSFIPLLPYLLFLVYYLFPVPYSSRQSAK